MLQLKPADIKQMEEIFDDSVTKYIESLPNRVERILDRAVLSLLGLDHDHYLGYKIDHCNSRKSVILKLVEERTMAPLEQLLGPLLDAAIVTACNDPKIIGAIVKEITSRVERTLKDKAYKASENWAEAQIKYVIDNIGQVSLTGALPNTDAEDPNSYETKLGAMILERIAASAAEGKPIRVVRKDGTLVEEK